MWLILCGCEFLVLLLFLKKKWNEKSIFSQNWSPPLFSFLSLFFFLSFFFPVLLFPSVFRCSTDHHQPASSSCSCPPLLLLLPLLGAAEASSSGQSSDRGGLRSLDSPEFACFRWFQASNLKLEAWTLWIFK